ncbi:MAG: SIS domain-containing protein [Anaerolineae bacterium]|nr:SIS domain-containing protein [Anaerolineae bacterium]
MAHSFTWQEISSQPETWQATLEAFAASRTTLAHFLDHTRPDQLFVTGCGSTYYLARAAAATLAHCARVPACALPASELWLYADVPPAERPMLLAVSRSGTTTETLRATDRFRETYGGPVLVVTCYPQSPLAQKADLVLACPAAQEQSIAQTRSFSSMFVLTQALAATMAQDDHLLARLGKLPAACTDLVARLGDLGQKDLARQLGENLDLERLFFLGGGALYGLACEAMLKTKEMSLSYAEAFHPMEFRHGPMSMVNEQTLVVGLLSDTGQEQELAVLHDMQGLGGHTLALVEDAATLGETRPDYVVELNSGLGEWERGALYLPVLQRLAFHRAVAKGLDPDKPHNLKAVIEL